MSGSFVEHVVDQLAGLGSAQARAMFGGHGLYLEGAIFGIVYDEWLYLKVDDATRPRYEAEGMGPFSPGPGRTMRSYPEVPAEGSRTPTRSWTGPAKRPRSPGDPPSTTMRVLRSRFSEACGVFGHRSVP